VLRLRTNIKESDNVKVIMIEKENRYYWRIGDRDIKWPHLGDWVEC